AGGAGGDRGGPRLWPGRAERRGIGARHGFGRGAPSVGGSGRATAFAGARRASGDRGAPRLLPGAPSVGGSRRATALAGARRASGGMGAISGPPILVVRTLAG